jgi:hypothetical protein
VARTQQRLLVGAAPLRMGRRTARKLNTLSRTQPDLVARFESGELSAYQAVVEGGLVDERYTISRNSVRAARTIATRLPALEVDALILALARHQLRHYDCPVDEYLAALREEILEGDKE